MSSNSSFLQSEITGKKRAFISFDFDNDQFLRTAIVSQAKNPESPFEIEDWSVKEPFPQATWERRVFEIIKRCSVVIVMVGEQTYRCEGVLKEIQMAYQASKPIFGLHGYPTKTCPIPRGLNKTYRWTWPNLRLLIEGNR